MIAASPPAPAGRGRCPQRARELAACLSALFERDVEIARRLNGAQRRLRDANERLWSGLSPDAVGVICDGAAPAGASVIAALMSEALCSGRRGSEAAVLGALQQAHWTIDGAFCDYQTVAEERRQLAADTGEVIRRFVDALVAAGWCEEQARSASVCELAGAVVR
jgi:hypothetical protein